MTYDQFIGQVQHRAQLASTDGAVRAVRSTLQTLADRLTPEEARDLAAQLPREIGYFLTHEVQPTERFGLQEFFNRVSQREETDLPVSVYHARVVIEVLQEAVSGGEIQDVRAQLPSEFDPLFESGSKGELTRK